MEPPYPTFDNTLENFTILKSADQFFAQEKACIVKFMETARQSLPNLYGSNKSLNKLKHLLPLEVLEKVEQISLPKSLKMRLKNAVRFKELELLTWLHWNHPALRCDPNRLFDHFFWNVEGTIDTPKTIRNVLNDNRIPAEDRFLISCHYCCDDFVRHLWNRLPNAFQKKVFEFPDIRFFSDYWIYVLRSKLPLNQKFIDFGNAKNYRCLVQEAFRQNNSMAVKRFWPKLNRRSQIHALETFKCKGTNMLMYFLSRRDLPRETEFFQYNTIHIFKMYIDSFIWNDNLFKTLEFYKQAGQEKDYFTLFEYMTFKMKQYPFPEKMHGIIYQYWSLLASIAAQNEYLPKIYKALTRIAWLEDDKKILNAVLRVLTREDKRAYLECSEPSTAVVFYKKHRLDLLDYLIKEAYDDEQKAKKYRKVTLQRQFCLDLEEEEWELLIKTADWAVQDEDERNEFIRDIVAG